MNVFNKVSLESLKKNKSRTIVTIIGIILSTAMICAVTTFISSFQNYMLQTAIYQEGNWHGRFNSVTYDSYENMIKDERIEDSTLIQQIGFSKLDKKWEEDKPYIYLLGANSDLQNNLPFRVTEGRYPEKNNEIILPDYLNSFTEFKYKIGDTIDLDLGKRVLDGKVLTQQEPSYIYTNNGMVFLGEEFMITESHSYTIVGFYEQVYWRLEESNSPGYVAFTLPNLNETSNYMYDVFFRVKDSREVYDFLKEGSIKYSTGGESNTSVLMAMGVSNSRNLESILLRLGAIVMSLIVFGSISLIYNAFSISVSERTKQFGLLTSIGASKKQIKKMVIFEALSMSAIGIPLGIFSGILGIGVTLKLIGKKFKSLGFPLEMEMSVSMISIIIAVLIALLTVLISVYIPAKRATKVSAIEAIRQNNDIKENLKRIKTPKFIYKIFGTPGMLADKYYKRSKKKYRTTVFSLFMSIVLFVSASSFINYLIEASGVMLDSQKYDLQLFDIDVDMQKNNLTIEKLLEDIGNIEGVEDVVYSTSIHFQTPIDKKNVSEDYVIYRGRVNEPLNTSLSDSEKYSISASLNFINNERFRKIASDNNIDVNKYFNKEEPLAVACTNISVFLDGKFRNIEILKDKTLEKIIGANDSNEEIAIGNYISNQPFFVDENSNEISLVLPYEACPDILASSGSYFMKTESIEVADKVYEYIKSVNLNSATLYNNGQERADKKNMIIIIQVFSYGFIVLISLIAAANVFNTISTNISLRRRDFAMLKSLGMSKKEFNRMLSFESLLYGTKSLLYGLIVSTVISYLIAIVFSDGYELVFRPPWSAMLIATISIFILVFATMMYSIKKVNKENIIDVLKNDNI